jgi:undecaprenyl-diphosphatase
VQGLEALDERLFFLINNGLAAKALDPFFLGLSALGEWAIGLMALVFLSGRGRRTLYRHIAVLAAALVVLAPVRTQVRRLADRDRPEARFQKELSAHTVRIRLLESHRVKAQSFPSGHSMLAFFFMAYVALHNRAQRFWALALAFLIALSRVYVGAHFPGDCLAGGLMGAAGGWVAWMLFGYLRQSRGWAAAVPVLPPAAEAASKNGAAG